jgi:hypothetical protein
MPSIIVITKRNVPLLPVRIDVIAGPGQNPPRPHPIPNIAAPTSSRKSRSLFVGK